MSAFIVVTGDTAEFPADCFTGALTEPMSTPMSGTARFKVAGKLACQVGDHRAVALPCSYRTATHTIPGAAIVTISALTAPQQSRVAASGSAAVLLTAQKFTCELTITVPASVVQNGATVTDPLTKYVGQGEFKSSNDTARARE